MIQPSKEFWEVFKKTEGALSCCEAIAIMNIAAQAPVGEYLELGTYKGKSAMSAIHSLNQDGVFHSVDPEFEKAIHTEEVIYQIYSATSTKIPVICFPSFSTEIIPQFNILSYVFVDSGSHGDGLPMAEVKLLEDRLITGGIIVFHDFRSQFIEVEQAYNYLIGTGKYEEISISWEEVKDYVREHDLEKGNNSWHHNELDFPCFVGALRRK